MQIYTTRHALTNHPICYYIILHIICIHFFHISSRFYRRLQTGWSTGKPSAAVLDSAEKEAIIAVIQRNEQLEIAERQRVGRLVERVEKIKQRAAECGPKNCRSVSVHGVNMDHFFNNNNKKPLAKKIIDRLEGYLTKD